jgi:uncharacterized protein
MNPFMDQGKHPSFGNGKICYIEIPATDIDQSSAFYQKVFGWQVRRRGDGSVGFDDGVGEVSGSWVLGRTASTRSGLLVSIMVDNAQATLEAILIQGGKIVEPIGKDFPEITALFSDPAGNVMSIYQHRR